MSPSINYFKYSPDSILPEDDDTVMPAGGSSGPVPPTAAGGASGQTGFRTPKPSPAKAAVPSPDTSALTEKTDTLAKIQQQKPLQPKPKWWQQLGAAAVGGLAGLSNSQHRGPAIDPAGAEDAIYGMPAYKRQLSNWNTKVEGAQADVTAETAKLAADQKIQQAASLDALRKKQGASADATKAFREKQANAPPPLLHGPKYIYDPKTDKMIWQEAPTPPKPRTFNTEESYLTNKLDDPDPAVRAAAQAKLDARHTKNEPNTNVDDVLLNQDRYTPAQVSEAKRIDAARHRPPQAGGAKSAEESATDAVLSAYQGDWAKVKAAGYDAVKNIAGIHAPKIWDTAGKAVAAGAKEQRADTKANQLPPAAARVTAAADSTIQQSQHAISLLGQMLKKNPSYFGPTLSMAELKRKYSDWNRTEPPEFGAVDTALESVMALQPGQHQFRSAAALDQFKRAAGIDPRTGKISSREWLKNPRKIIQGLRELSNFNANLKANTIKASGKNPAPGGAQPPAGVDPLDHYINSLNIPE
jgi:hypothetical protein